MRPVFPWSLKRLKDLEGFGHVRPRCRGFAPRLWLVGRGWGARSRRDRAYYDPNLAANRRQHLPTQSVDAQPPCRSQRRTSFRRHCRCSPNPRCASPHARAVRRPPATPVPPATAHQQLGNRTSSLFCACDAGFVVVVALLTWTSRASSRRHRRLRCAPPRPAARAPPAHRPPTACQPPASRPSMGIASASCDPRGRVLSSARPCPSNGWVPASPLGSEDLPQLQERRPTRRCARPARPHVPHLACPIGAMQA